MEHGASVTSLVIVIIAAFLTPILLHRFKLTMIPVVVAEIIVGLIIGQSGFDLVDQGSWLEILSTLGFIFLMFLSGLEIDFSIFARKKKKAKPENQNTGAPNPVWVATLVFLGIFVISLALSFAFVWAGFIDNAFLMTLIISTISLGVVVPTLKDAQMMKTTIGQTILLIAVIADLVTMILLAVFVSIYGESGGNTWLLLILFAAGVLFYYIGKKFRHQSYVETMTKGTIQIDTRAVFTLILLLVALSEQVGAENILGAFLAGTLVSLLSPNPEMVKRLDSFGYGFLIPIFFVMVGVEIDIWSLFTDTRVLLLIPLLFLALLVSKVVPALLLSKWYDMKTVFGSGFILTSTLSLVIAAAAIGKREGMIDDQMEGALILVAVLTCLIGPILFKKIYGRFEEEDHKTVVSFVGSNRMTLPVVRELDVNAYETHLYHMKMDKIDDRITRQCFDIKELDDYDVEQMKEIGVFDVDLLVASTGDEERNAKIARFAKEQGVERVIARIESTDLAQEMKDLNVSVFSVFLSTKALLKAMIEAPNVLDILTTQENALYQINMNNSIYNGTHLREFPFTGDVIMVRIFRGKDSIVPHGDTELKMGDRLIVTGSHEYVEELKAELEYCEWC
ncbi:monovalent cation:proton antiporter family protein [Halobacillus sp. ACCC02827]|uniref:monovalent cation:proton antiporter family protein n=1 Tax=unclassified Halobacillus TaxID=2636472 RepID=UPI0002A4D4B5|nr:MULTISPECIES: monovalent cation:proton antiporter family protein [unclassified Halobacillus]ELK45187.1 Na+/H+ antiporter family protein [Halobacillus sp. BAB-2008]WJE16871.1 monovalent cation:proton antiporter family protein [Halobacillus sp. ACCC02827]